jgi:uncharacterized protein YigA (DUF484 family)
MSNPLTPITEDDIAQYLVHNPQFFERHADILSSIVLSGPHGQRAVNLQERQAMMLRDKIRRLEGHIMEMIRHGNGNLALSDKLICWAAELLLMRDATTLMERIPASVEHQFAVPQVALRVWDVAPQWQVSAADVTQETRDFASGLKEPLCGANSGFEPTQWLRHPQDAASVALLALRPVAAEAAPAMGLLVLASSDSQRFTSTMGTDFLRGLALLTSAALGVLQTGS